MKESQGVKDTMQLEGGKKMGYLIKKVHKNLGKKVMNVQYVVDGELVDLTTMKDVEAFVRDRLKNR